ncbi:MAG: Flp pilus assembly complex ATPase component TadA [Candidatus Woesearchaeota archaeon]|nr:MAG: Flp pilus assembly complex ATPase component TadA [Candidatus Woesearchaeota archaeon]
MEETYVVDTSVIIEKAVSRLIKEEKIKGKILVPRAVLGELEHQANQGQEIGFLGLEELQELQVLARKGVIELSFVGNRPTAMQIKYAKEGGEIDALIKELAYENGATLITADRVQSASAKAYGLKVEFLRLKSISEKLGIEEFFDEHTMSIHLKEGCYPLGKRGAPGNWKLEKVGDKILTPLQVQELAKEVVEAARLDQNSFVEISRKGSTVVQYRNYRVVIVRPPVSDGEEITVVRPIKKLNLEEYNLQESIASRLKTKARGVVVAGETGSGKSTFAQALAEDYVKLGLITKTVESPRDLDLSDNITQYSKNFTSSEEIHDILFLSRPDNVIFDEIRDTPDFKLFTDLRLSGGNALGVLHAASAIDAVQRFIGRLDVGMIPSVLDTILFMEKGNLSKVLTLQMRVKVPAGMTESDLARPVVEVIDFTTNKAVYEIYSYGEETVVVPIEGQMKSNPLRELAAREVERVILEICSAADVEFISDNKAIVKVPESEIPYVIGKKGSRVSQLEEDLGISIDVQELDQHYYKKKKHK